MAGLRGVFLDTSVLVAGMVDLGRGSQAPFAVLDAVAGGRIERPSTAWHCCLEFFSVTTRLPEEYRLEPVVALRFVDEEIFARFSVHGLAETRRKRFLTRAVAEGVVGGAVYDAHIAEIAKGSGAKIVVTENRRHFSPLLRDGVRVAESSELAAEL